MTLISREDSWRRWLSDKSSRDVLRQCAKTIYHQARELNLSWDSWSYPRDLRLDSPAGRQILDDITSELHSYLWSDGFERSLALADLLLAGDTTKFASFVVRNYIIHKCKRTERTMRASPWRAYYRHVRQVLQNADGFTYEAQQDSAFYASVKGELTRAPDSFLKDENYGQWSIPRISTPDIHKKKSILILARAFWEESVRHTGQQCLVPIRDFINYIGSHHDLNMRSTELLGSCSPAIDDGEGSGTGGEQNDAVDPYGLSPEQEATVSEAAGKAEDLAIAWSREMREIFALRYGEDLSLQEIADRVGFKTPANVDYHLRKAQTSFREFLSLHVDLSEMEDGDAYFKNQQGAKTSFFSKLVAALVAFCKTINKGLSHGQRQQ